MALEQAEIDAILDQADKRMAEMLTGTLNGALTKRISGLQKSMEEKQAEFQANLQKQIEGLRTTTTSTETEGGKKNKDRDCETPPNEPTALALNDMRAKMLELSAKADAADARAAAERAKNRNSVLRNETDAGLVKLGIENPVIRLALLAKFVAEGRIRYADDNDDESPIEFVGDDRLGMSLEGGLKAWGKTAEAANFIPARQVRGAGTQPRGGTAGGGGTAGNQNRDAALSALGEAFFREAGF